MILLILAAIVILILNLILFTLFIAWERQKRLKRLRRNLSNFSPVQLNNRMERYAKTIRSSKYKDKLDDDIKETTLISYKSIERQMKVVEDYALPIKTFNFLAYRSEYNKLIEKIKEYEIEYLENRFELFDLTSDIEIEKAILDSLKKRLGKAREAITNNPLKDIRENKKLNNKLTRISIALKNLEELIDKQIKHLSPEFIDLVKKSDKDIKSLTSELYFMNFHIKHLEEVLKAPMTQIVEIYKDNKNILKMLKPKVKDMVNLINHLKTEIRNDIPELRVKKVNENVLKLDQIVSKLNLLIRSNVDYAKFNSSNEEALNRFLIFIRENNGLFISEIKRHKIPDEKQRILAITDALQKFEIAINKYEREQQAQFNVHTPSGVSNLILDGVYAYQQYIKIVGENIKDINQVNDATNRVNEEIAEMNTLLLQAEYNVNSLTGMFKEKFNAEKEALQEQVELLWIKFKSNIDFVEASTFDSIAKFKKKIKKLVSKTRGKAFELYFAKETILFLNKYKGTNKKFDDLLNSINDSFLNEKYNDALRKSKEVIEIYGIK